MSSSGRPVPAQSGHTIQDEGSDLTARAKLNFTGTGVSAADNPGTGATDVTINAGTAPDADASTKGLVQLAGDLAGTAASPQIAAGAIVNADINAAAAIAESKLNLASDAAAGTASRRTLGTGSTQAAAGNDARLSDTRTPTDGSVTSAKLAAALLDTDSTLAANSDTKLASQKAVKTYVDAHASSSSRTTHPEFLTSSLVPATDIAANPQGSVTDGSTVLQATTRSVHPLRRAGMSISLVYANLSDWGGSAPANAISIRAGVEVSGVTNPVPVYFRGARDVTIQPDTLVISDPIAAPHAKDALLALRTQITVTSGQVFTYNTITNWVAARGEGVESGTTVTDKTTSGTITSGSVYGFAPFAILTDWRPGAKPLVIARGDSINYGYNDTPSAWGAGPVYQALATNWPFLNLSFIGEQAHDYVSPANGHRAWLRRMLAAVGAHIVDNYGTNDMQGARTLSQIQADVLTIATWDSYVAPHYQTTIIPRATSTDGFTTLGNQTPFAAEAVRLGYNAWLRDGAPIDATTKAAVAVGTNTNVLRCAVYDSTPTVVSAGSGAGSGHPISAVFEWADVVESSRDSGKWKTNATANFYTPDGTHPKANMTALIGAAIPTSLFT
jgi:hypothetical protein